MPSWLRMKIIRVSQEKFTVSAAAIVFNDERKVLVLNHVLRPYSGWGLPGGFIEAGEQPEAGIRRELREETGLELHNVQMFKVRTLNRHIEMLFTATANGDVELKTNEIFDHGWFTPDTLPEEMSPAQKRLIRDAIDAKAASSV